MKIDVDSIANSQVASPDGDGTSAVYKTATHTQTTWRIVAAAAVIPLIVPSVDLLWTARCINSLKNEMVNVEVSIAGLRRDVARLGDEKNEQLAAGNKRLDAMQQQRFQLANLRTVANEAMQKLAAIRELVAEHQKILTELNSLKSEFPEITSGP